MALDILIDEVNVSLATLSVELERATISHDAPNDSSLYVTEPGLSQAERLEFCNRINERLYMPSFHVYRVENNA